MLFKPNSHIHLPCHSSSASNIADHSLLQLSPLSFPHFIPISWDTSQSPFYLHSYLVINVEVPQDLRPSSLLI